MYVAKAELYFVFNPLAEANGNEILQRPIFLYSLPSALADGTNKVFEGFSHIAGETMNFPKSNLLCKINLMEANT